MAVSRANKRVAQFLTRDRFRNVLRRFVPPSQFNSFFDMLADTGSAVNGSVVRRLLAHQSEFLLLSASASRFQRSANLNIVTVPGQLEQCKAWFTKMGYSKWYRGATTMA